MKIRTTAVVASALAFGLVGHASAQQAATKGDLRCVLMTAAAYGEAKVGSKDAADMQAPAAFFLGRIEGREPDLDLAPAMRSELLHLTSADFHAEAERCGTERQVLLTESKALAQMLSELRASRAAKPPSVPAPR